MMIALYRQAMSAAAPALRLLLAARLRRGKEDPARLPERQGIASRPRPLGPLIWVHGASVGEALSVLPLIDRLLGLRDDLSILVTTGTLTSAKLMAERLPPRACHQFVPLDCPAWVERFLDHWRPDLALWVESELWPALLTLTAARGVPMALVNARLSERSFARWQKLAGTAKQLLDCFAVCLAQSTETAARLRQLGRQAVDTGNLKAAAAPLPVDTAELTRLQAAIAGRPVWLAASTHPGEEEIVAAAQAPLAAAFPHLLTLLVPRHATRGAEIAAQLRHQGLVVARRAAAEPIERDTAIYLADTMGELGLFYRLAPIAFIGGSLVAHGGQNPLEPAQLGAAILHGPWTQNFADIVSRLDNAGGAVAVKDAAGLARAVAAWLADPLARARAAEAASQVAASSRGALERVMAALDPLLARLPPSERALASA